MSQTNLISSTPDKNQRNKWNTIITGYKHSTPDSGKQIKPLSLSLSRIESSSSTGSRKNVKQKLSSPVLGGINNYYIQMYCSLYSFYFGEKMEL